MSKLRKSRWKMKCQLECHPRPLSKCHPPRSMLPHPLDQSSSPFKPYDAGKKLLSRSDINLPLRIQPHPSAFFPPPPNPLTHPFTPFAPHLPLHHLHIASKASKLEVGVGVTNNCWQPTIGSSLQRWCIIFNCWSYLAPTLCSQGGPSLNCIKL